MTRRLFRSRVSGDRYGLPAGAAAMALRVKPDRVAKVKLPKSRPTHPCPICGLTTDRTCCSVDCGAEWNARRARERYRARAGLAPTWDRPTKPWARSAVA